MAIFSFNCEAHGDYHVFLKKGESRHPCPKCGLSSKRILKTSPAHVKEVIDNGLMHKAIERYTDIDEVMKERNAAHKKKMAEDI